MPLQLKEPRNEIHFGPQPGPQTAFLESPADIVIYGGARGGGKSYALLLEAMRHSRNRDFAAVLFRRTYPQIFQEGGLWDTSEKIYSFAGATPVRGNGEWKFPAGATVAMRHMENEADRYTWLGASITLIGFDELATFTEKQFFFMLGSNRSTCGVRPYIRATTNPEPGWLAKFIQWWWNPETGYAIPERSGVIRWFIRDNDQLIWADTAEELRQRKPDLEPKSVTFIPAYVEDNKILLDVDKGYRSNLLALGTVDRERYHRGNWKIKSTAGTMFRREWFKHRVRQAPANLREMVRYWDLAASTPDDSTDPDWTVGAKVGFLDGQWYILHIARFQKSPKENEDAIRMTARDDGAHVRVAMEQEGGASGKSLISYYARNILAGYDFRGRPALKDKVTRAGPFSAACENGNVILVDGTWVETFLDECEAFPEVAHDDQVDGVTGAMAELSEFATGGGDPNYEAEDDPYASEKYASTHGARDAGLGV